MNYKVLEIISSISIQQKNILPIFDQKK